MRKRQLMVMATLVAIAGAPVQAQDREANWLKRPTSRDIEAVWPSQALRDGVGGKATIGCTVTVHGTLRDCRVLHEEPADRGFGGAGIALSSQFLMRPALRNGAPVESTVRIPINFPKPNGPAGPTLPISPRNFVYTQLPWKEGPTYADVLAAYPAKAKAAKVGGMAALDCRIDKDGGVSACRTIKETPSGMGFAAAAKSLTDRFVTPTTNSKGDSVAGSRVHVTFSFPAAALEAATPVIGKPEWMAVPAIHDVAAVVPEAARKAKAYKARVMMSCKVVAGGGVEGCAVESEDPSGLGYGAAALTLSRFFRLGVWTDEGLPTVGGTVRIPLRFDLESAMTAAAAPAKR